MFEIVAIGVFGPAAVWAIYSGIRQLRRGPRPVDKGAPAGVERAYRAMSPFVASITIAWGVLVIWAILTQIVPRLGS